MTSKYILRHIIEMMPGNVYWKDRNGIHQGCNKNLANLYNLSSSNDIAGKSDFDLLQATIAEKIREVDLKVMEEDKEYSVEEPFFNDEGEEKIFLSKKLPLKNKKGEIDGILGISFDITERKQQEQELKEAKEQAEANNKLKTAFIRDMEHDIRTPFTGIYTLANSLFEKETDVRKKELLGYVSSSAKELLDYCNAILDFSRIESSTFPVVNKKFNLHQLLRSVLTMERPAAKAKELELHLQLPPDVPTIVLGDSFRLQRILINLVGNAIKFTKAGYVKLSAELIEIQNKRVIISFSVEDTGIGIPAHQQNYIFERFTRVSPANKGLYTGIGLGLKAVKQFMEELEGEIDIESEPGQGTLFTCTLAFKMPLSTKKHSANALRLASSSKTSSLLTVIDK